MRRDYLAEAQQKYAKLERLYHVGAQKAWDGRKVLGDLLAKHGGIRLAPDKKRFLYRRRRCRVGSRERAVRANHWRDRSSSSSIQRY